jgi:hypothetical protein
MQWRVTAAVTFLLLTWNDSYSKWLTDNPLLLGTGMAGIGQERI